MTKDVRTSLACWLLLTIVTAATDLVIAAGAGSERTSDAGPMGPAVGTGTTGRRDHADRRTTSTSCSASRSYWSSESCKSSRMTSRHILAGSS